MRRSEPGVSGVRRRAGRARRRWVVRQPHRAVLDHARIRGLLSSSSPRSVASCCSTRPGSGLSDPVPKVRTLDDRAAEIEAVMDAVGFGKAALFGVSEGGPAAIFFAATRPERTRALILTGTFAYSFADGWDDFERDPAELRARLVPELGEDYTPSAEQLARLQAFCRAVRSAWGSGEAPKSASVGAARSACSEWWSACAPARGWRGRRSKRGSGSMCGRSCRRSPRRPWSSMPATIPLPVQWRPVPRRPHSRRAVARGRRRGPRALVHRARQDRDRDRGVTHRQPCRAISVTSRSAHRVVHRHGRVDATRGGDRRRAVACGVAPVR